VNCVVRVDGKVTGNKTTDGGFILGEKGVISGDVKTDRLLFLWFGNGGRYGRCSWKLRKRDC